MPKPKRRYTSPNQIEVEIEHAKQKATDLLRTADSFDALSKEHFKLAAAVGDADGQFYIEQGREESQKADKARVTATNILEGKVKYLTQKLAEIKTPVLEGILSDTSVEA